MGNVMLGNMRCPDGALVRFDEASKSHTVEPDGWVGESDLRAIELSVRESLKAKFGRALRREDLPEVEKETKKRISQLAAGRTRCSESGPVSEHSTDKNLIVVLCPVHGAIDARADIWRGQIS